MTTVETNELLDVWGRVSRWPEPMKLSLASKILESVRHRTGEPAERKSLRDLIGLWDQGRPPPTDEEVARILEEERMKKHG